MLRSRVLFRSFSGHSGLNQLESGIEKKCYGFNKLNELESRIEKIEKKNITTTTSVTEDYLDTPVLRFQKSNKSKESQESQDPTKGYYEIDFTITKAGLLAGFSFSIGFYFIVKMFHI